MKKGLKIVVSLLLTLCMLMPMATMVFATADIETASVYTGEKNNSGDWTKQDWIDNFEANKTKLTIDSAYELVTFAQASSKITFTDDTYVKVTTDIVLNEDDVRSWGADLSGIFAFPGITNFVGTFDGNGKTVSGVYLSHYDTSFTDTTDKEGNPTNNGNTYDGFFKVLSKGTTTIKDLALVNSLFTTTNASAYGASFIGRINSSANVTLSGLYSNAIVLYAGGSTAGLGGIVSLVSATPNYPTIKGCVFDGYVQAQAGIVGGIVGLNANYSDDTNKFAVTVEDSVNLGTLVGGTVGGIIGDGNRVTINRCIDYNGYNLIGKIQKTIEAENNYLFAGQKIDTTGKFTGASGTITADNKGANVSSLSALDFAGTDEAKTDWTTRANDYPMPKAVYDNFGEYIGTFAFSDVTDFAAASAHVNNTVYMTFYKQAIQKQYANGVRIFDIASEDQLCAIVELLNAGAFSNYGYGVTFKLTRNMVFNKDQDAKNWAQTAPDFVWTPIDNFRGTFDGQGNTISGVYFKSGSSSNAADNYRGVFGVLLESATVKNLGVINSYMSFNYQYGNGVIGRINGVNVTVKGIYTDMIIDGNVTNGTGGIVGLVSNTGTDSANPTSAVIEDCVFAGTINAIGPAGGIVGQGATYQFCKVVIRNCANYGNITSQNAAGAIIGHGSTIALDQCLNAGVVTTNYEPTQTHPTDNVSGALIGSFGASSTAVKALTVTNCYNTSDVLISDTASYSTTAKPTVIKESDKGTNPFNSGWNSNSKYLEDKYPIPATVYNNFFKTDVKYVQSTAVNNGTYSVRFIAEVDSLNYSKAGFNVKVTLKNGKSKTLTTTETKVYKSIVSGTEENYREISALKDRYFIALTITDMPTTAQKYEITPYTIGDREEYSYGVTKVLTFDSNGVCTNAYDNGSYNVIYSSSKFAHFSTCAKISSALNKLSGITSDVYNDSEIAINDASYEVLVGDTNRPQSIAAKDALNGQKYSITQDGNKIVIVASDDLALDDAINYFMNDLRSTGEGTFDYPVNYQSTAYQTFDLITNGVANYKIVYTDFYNNLNKHSDTTWNDTDIGFTQTKANELAASLNTLTGVTFECIHESEMTSAPEIVIGKSNGVTDHYFDYYQNGVHIKNGDIYIYGHNHDGIKDAVNNFLSRVKKHHSSVDTTKYSLYCEAEGFKANNSAIKYDIPLPAGRVYEGAYTTADGDYFVYENCAKTDFDAYCNILKDAGFASYFSRQASTNYFAAYYKGTESVWVYYVNDRAEIRVIFEKYQELPTFDVGTKVTEATLTQYGFDYEKSSNYAIGVTGMSFIVTLEDGSYAIIDGGGNGTAEQKDTVATELYNYLVANNKRTDGKIVISAWFLTHLHSDHFGICQTFADKYASSVTLKYFIYNEPAPLTLFGAANAGSLGRGQGNGDNVAMEKIAAKYTGAKVFLSHTGATFDLGGVFVEIMSTYEDLYNHDKTKHPNDPCMPNAVEDYNDTSMTFRLYFNKGESDEATVFILGDAFFAHGERLASMWDAAYMKSTIVQAAHHGFQNGVTSGVVDKVNPIRSSTYAEIRAAYCLWSQGNHMWSRASGVRSVLEQANSSIKYYLNADVDGNAVNHLFTFNGGVKVTTTKQ